MPLEPEPRLSFDTGFCYHFKESDTFGRSHLLNFGSNLEAVKGGNELRDHLWGT